MGGASPISQRHGTAHLLARSTCLHFFSLLSHQGSLFPHHSSASSSRSLMLHAGPATAGLASLLWAGHVGATLLRPHSGSPARSAALGGEMPKSEPVMNSCSLRKCGNPGFHTGASPLPVPRATKLEGSSERNEDGKERDAGPCPAFLRLAWEKPRVVPLNPIHHQPAAATLSGIQAPCPVFIRPASE